MARVSGPPGTWSVPRLPTPGRLARWLGLTPGELDWFADCKQWNGDGPEPLRHYTLCWLRKPAGKYRLLEVPKSRLKAIRRKLLDGLLAFIPPHDAAHAYRTGRSILGFAAPHAGRRLVLRLDLRDFFPSVRALRGSTRCFADWAILSPLLGCSPGSARTPSAPLPGLPAT